MEDRKRNVSSLQSYDMINYFFKNDTYMTYMAPPQHKNPCPGGHEIYNFGRPFLGHFYYALSL